MPCGCKEAERVLTAWERQLEWNKRAMALLSEIASRVGPHDPELMTQTSSLIADLNAIGLDSKPAMERPALESVQRVAV